MSASSSRKSDFNAHDLIQTQTDLEGRVDEIEKKISTNERFVDFFTKSIADSKKIEQTFKDAFKDVIKKDDEVRESIKNLIRESDEHDVKISLKRVFSIGGWFITIIITAAATAIVTYLVTPKK